MKATFVEMTTFEKYRAEYLPDEQFRLLQLALMNKPTMGEVIQGTGGLRKLRWNDPKRGKGKRGGLRVIYYFYRASDEFWLFTLYNKDEMVDLTSDNKKAFKKLLTDEVEKRQL